jgi:hypothetical protein
MRWNHIMDVQPAHDEMIVRCISLGDNDYVIGISKYYQTCTFPALLEDFKRCEMGTPDFYWISASEFPFPKKEESNEESISNM